MNYTLIAYKPDSSDYCMGCHMGSYSSDLEMKNRLEEDELLEMWSNLKSKYTFMGPNEAGYEFVLMKGKYIIFDEIGGMADHYYEYLDDFEEDEGANEAYEADQKWFKEFSAKLETATQEKIAAEKQRRSDKEQAKRAEKEEKEKQRRKVEFEKLKEEFEGNV
jgi:hypothetical protein